MIVKIQRNFITREKRFLQSHKGITDVDYMHAKKIRKDFKIKKLGKYHDLHIQRDTFGT